MLIRLLVQGLILVQFTGGAPDIPDTGEIKDGLSSALEDTLKRASDAGGAARDVIDAVDNMDVADMKDDLNQAIDAMDFRYNDVGAMLNSAVGIVTGVDMSDVPEGINGVVDGVNTDIGEIINEIKEEIDDTDEIDMTNLADELSDVMQDTMDISLGEIADTMDDIGSVIQRVLNEVRDVDYKKLGDALQEAFQDARGVDISQLGDAINEAIQGVGDIDLSGLDFMLNSFIKGLAYNTDFGKLGEVIGNTIRNLSRIDMKSMGDKVSEGFRDMDRIDVDGQLGDMVNDGIESMADVNFGELGDAISRGMASIGGIGFGQVGDAVNQKLKGMGDLKIEELGEHLEDGIADIGTLNIGNLEEPVDHVLESLSKMNFGRAGQKIKDGTSDLGVADLGSLGDVIRDNIDHADEVKVGDVLDSIDMGTVDFSEISDGMNEDFNKLNHIDFSEMRDRANQGIVNDVGSFKFSDISSKVNQGIDGVGYVDFSQVSNTINHAISEADDAHLTEAKHYFNAGVEGIDFEAGASIRSGVKELGDAVERLADDINPFGGKISYGALSDARDRFKKLAERTGIAGDLDLDKVITGNIPMDEVDGVYNAATLRLLDNDMLDTMEKTLSTEYKDAICSELMSTIDTDLLGSLIDHGFDCVETMGRHSELEVGGAQARVMMDRLRQKNSSTTWDIDKWRVVLRMFDGVTSEDISNMALDIFTALVDNGEMDVDKLADDPAKERAFNRKITASLGSAEHWDASQLKKLGGKVIAALDLEELSSIDASEFAKIIPSLASTVVVVDKSKKKALADKVIDGLGGEDNIENWNATQISQAAIYCLTNPTVMKKMDPDALADAVDEISEYVTSKRDATRLATTLMASSIYSDASTLSTDDLSSLGKSLSGFPPSFTGSLDPSALAGAVDAFKDCDFLRGQAKNIWEKLQESGSFQPASMTLSEIESCGKIVEGFSKEDFEAMPDDTVVDGISTFGSLILKADQARGLLTKLKSAMGGDFGSKAAEMGNLFPYAQRSEVKSLSFSDLKLSCENTDTFHITPAADQARVIMSKIVEELGVPDNTNANYTGSCFQRWGVMAALGTSNSFISGLRSDSEIYSIMDAVKDYEQNMTEAQTKAWSKKLLQLLSDGAADEVDEIRALQFAPFMKHFSDSELQMVDRSILPVVCQGIGNCGVHTLPMSEIRRLKKFCLKYIVRDDTGEITDRSNAAPLDDNDVRSLGSLLCGMEESDMEKLSLDAIKNNIEDLSKCPLDNNAAKALIKRAKELDSDYFTDGVNLISSGPLLAYLSEEELDNSVSSSELGESLPNIVEAMEEADENREKRDEAFKAELSDSDRTDIKDGRGRLVKKALEEVASSRRKRSAKFSRSAVSYSCADVQSLGWTVVVLPADDIANMQNSEFNDCFETFGSISDWEEGQLSALAAQAKTAKGAPATWTSDEISQAGSIVGGLSASEIGDLALDTSDIMMSIGAHDVYNSAQLVVGFDTWFAASQSSDAANIDADELMALGNFACGPGDSIISGISASAYGDAASTIGALTTCEESQLTAYANLAKHADAFGDDVTQWTEADVTAIGAVLGGITKSEMAQLSSDQIAAIVPKTISQIPPVTFSGLSVQQIGYLTSSQANAVTEEMQQSLSEDQRRALIAAGAENFVEVNDDDNGNGTGHASISVFVFAMIVCRMFIM